VRNQTKRRRENKQADVGFTSCIMSFFSRITSMDVACLAPEPGVVAEVEAKAGLLGATGVEGAGVEGAAGADLPVN